MDRDGYWGSHYRGPEEGEADRRSFNVLAPAGEYRGSVSVPVALLQNPPPFFTDRAIDGVLRDRETEIERVVVLRYELEER